MKTKRMQTVFLILAGLLLATSSVFASDPQDVKGGKDHPLFNRIPDYKIEAYEEREFEVYDKFADSKGSNTSVEGHYYFIGYYVKKGEKAATEAQVLRNFTHAVTSIGGSVTYQTRTDAYLKIAKDNRVTWVRVRAKNRGEGYQLWIIEEAAMKQDIVADAKSMAQDLSATGRVALYGIYFDFDKSEVKSESDLTLKEIAKLLSQDPKLKLYVVGHTDSVGDFNYNLKLSQARADAVVKTLVSKYGTEGSRLKAFGAGPAAPVTTNDTEEGKAKNRRVELVKQ
ncbi:MAG: OmpA family protein [Thermodesulfovibrionales bacterium]|nr:OmpA family protein [Thermodesulfovibrionales bacterium]